MIEYSSLNLSLKEYFYEGIFIDEIFEENRTANKDITFENCIFNKKTVIENIKGKRLTFKNCVFHELFSINNSNFTNLIFLKCEFKSDISFFSNQCSSDFILNEIKAKDITLKDTNNQYTQNNPKIILLGNNVINKLSFESGNDYSNIIFRGGKYESIFFEGEFNNHIIFEKKIFNNYLYFESSSFKYRIDILEGEFEAINFYRSSFTGLVIINDFNDYEAIQRDLKINRLSIHSSDFNKDISININVENINYIDLSNNNFKQTLNINSYTDKFNPSVIVMFSFDGANRGNIIIQRTCADINLGGINFGNIIIKDSYLTTLYFMEILNKGDISLINIDSGDFLVINDSILGNLTFLNSDINKFREIIINNSNLAKVNFNIYPKKILSYSKFPKAGYGIKKKSERIKNYKNVYNQLKQVAKSSGDIDISNKFQSLELKYLLLSKRISSDSIILFLNWISNNNGKSWTRGILFTISISFLFFIQYLKVLEENIIYETIYKDFILFITSFPKLEIEKYSELNNNWNVRLVIWFSRIFISYGIFQTITAFRKYVRK